MQGAIINDCGDELYHALISGVTVPPLTGRFCDMTIDDAYYISLRMMSRRIEAGERVIGKKIGVTSRAVQAMLKVDQPDFGFLTDSMLFEDGFTLSLGEHQLIQPRAEGEIAFKLKSTLEGPGVTARQVMAATESVMPCFEIVDSRIDNWQIKIQDTVADNASCGVFILGKQAIDPAKLDLAALEMTVSKNNHSISRGKGAAVQGHPANAVAWLANTLGRFGIALEAGEIILSGSLVPLEPVKAGDHMSLEAAGLGCVSVHFTD